MRPSAASPASDKPVKEGGAGLLKGRVFRKLIRKKACFAPRWRGRSRFSEEIIRDQYKDRKYRQQCDEGDMRRHQPGNSTTISQWQQVL